MTRMLPVLFRADDIGISRSTVLAARLACEQGVCRNVSVQAVGPHLDLVRELIVPLQRSGRIRIGLHVTLTCEWDAPRFRPIGRHPHPDLIAPDGAFVATPALFHERRLPAEAVLDEAAAQLAHLRAHGIAPDYADEHMCFGWVPGIAGAMPAFCRREGLIDADRLRFAKAPPRPRQAEPAADVLAQIALATAGPLRCVGHPILPDNENAAFRHVGQPDYRITADRDAQRRMFTDPRVVAALAERRMTSIRYDEV